jgi:hypothetical protein
MSLPHTAEYTHRQRKTKTQTQTQTQTHTHLPILETLLHTAEVIGRERVPVEVAHPCVLQNLFRV